MQKNENKAKENEQQQKKQIKQKMHKVKVNGREIRFDTPPVIKEGRTLVPIRAIAEGFKADVKWDPVTKTVTITKNGTVIVLDLTTGKAYINGVEKPIDVPAQIYNNRTVVPLRFISEAFKAKVDYNEETGDIDISESNPADTKLTDNSGTGTEAPSSSTTATETTTETTEGTSPATTEGTQQQ